MKTIGAFREGWLLERGNELVTGRTTIDKEVHVMRADVHASDVPEEPFKATCFIQAGRAYFLRRGRDAKALNRLLRKERSFYRSCQVR